MPLGDLRVVALRDGAQTNRAEGVRGQVLRPLDRLGVLAAERGQRIANLDDFRQDVAGVRLQQVPQRACADVAAGAEADAIGGADVRPVGRRHAVNRVADPSTKARSPTRSSAVVPRGAQQSPSPHVWIRISFSGSATQSSSTVSKTAPAAVRAASTSDDRAGARIAGWGGTICPNGATSRVSTCALGGMRPGAAPPRTR